MAASAIKTMSDLPNTPEELAQAAQRSAVVRIVIVMMLYLVLKFVFFAHSRQKYVLRSLATAGFLPSQSYHHFASYQRQTMNSSNPRDAMLFCH